MTPQIPNLESASENIGQIKEESKESKEKASLGRMEILFKKT